VFFLVLQKKKHSCIDTRDERIRRFPKKVGWSFQSSG